VPFAFKDIERQKMKKLINFIFLLLIGCAQLQHGQEQPVLSKNSKENIYYTTCGGAVETWADCYEKAAKTCNKNYVVIAKGDNSRGTQRDLTFQCKK